MDLQGDINERTSALSSGDLFRDTTGGCLKANNVNDKWVKVEWYEKCWPYKAGEKNNKTTLTHARNIS